MNKDKQLINKDQNTHIPRSLKSLQEWFASIITYKMDENSTISPITPSGLLISEEASRYIVPSPHLRPHQRIQIYNQQYWWRLLNTLHDNFPLVTRLFGYQNFNETIGIPYLLRYPPNHWSLSSLGTRLPKWITEHYQASDQAFILNATKLDWAFMASFIAPEKPPLNPSNLIQGNPESLLAYTFYLQPYIQVFSWEYDLFTFRDLLLKQSVDYWTTNDFSPLPKGKTYYFLLYRSPKNNMIWREISQAEYLLLDLLKKGSSIEAACAFLEKQEASVYEKASIHLQEWFQEWTMRHWLTLDKEKG